MLRRRRRAFQVLVVLMAGMAALKLGDEFRRLLWDHGAAGAIDLRNLHRWTGIWFAGGPLFQLGQAALYPPATYLMLWPLLGWISFEVARWMWAVTAIVGLGLSSVFAVRIVGAAQRREQLFATLLILSINGTGVAIGNGQLMLHVLPALLGAALLIENEERSLARDVAAGSLLTWTLVKPSIALPFVWIFLFRRGHWPTVVVALALYAALTLASAAAQDTDVVSLLQAMSDRATTATVRFPATRNLHALLVALGLHEWLAPASAVVFCAFGLWLWVLRRADLWVLMGVAALVSRMWTYHRVYDDGVILLAELALWRVARTGATPVRRTAADALLTANALVMLFPARFLDQSAYSWSPPWLWACTSVQAAVWLSTGVFLMNDAWSHPAEDRCPKSSDAAA